MRNHDTEADERAALQLEVLRRATAAIEQKRSGQAADPGDSSRGSRLNPLRRTAQIYTPDQDRKDRLAGRHEPWSGPQHSPETLFFA